MTMTFILRENATLGKPSEDGIYPVRLISEGQGSSGYYSGEVLTKYIAEALPAGTKIYFDHTDEDDDTKRGGTRSIRDIAGRTVDTPVASMVEGVGVAMDAHIKFTDEARKLAEVLGDGLGLSVEIHDGDKDEERNILEMRAHPLNSVALVTVAGRGGHVLQSMAESFRTAPGSEDRNPEGKNMTEITQEQLDATAEKAATLAASAVVEAFAAKEAARLAEAEQVEGPTQIEIAKALAESGLIEEQMDLALKAFEAGTPLADAISAQKTIAEKVAERANEEAGSGVFSEGASGKSNEDYYNSKKRN